MFSRPARQLSQRLLAQMFAQVFGWGLCLCGLAKSDDTAGQGNKVPARIAMCLPLAVPVDATTKVTVRGWGLEGVKEIRSSNPLVTLKVVGSGKATIPNKQDAKQIGDTQVELEVTVAKAAQAGEVELTIVDPEMKNQPHRLLLGSCKALEAQVLAEQEPNDGLEQAQQLRLPQIVDGRIDGDGNVDVFSFELSVAQSIAIEVHASRYGSNLDSILTLFDGRGNIIAVNDDTKDSSASNKTASGDILIRTGEQGSRTTKDSKIIVALPVGRYMTSLQDAHDRGGPAHPYRLTFTVSNKN